MTKMLDFYKCNLCGNIVHIMHTGADKLVCCGKPMELLKENTDDSVGEKHVPVVEKINGGYHIKVGAVEHPMLPEHYIEFIEVVTKNKDYVKFLKPGEKPEFDLELDDEIVMVREYCNIHGLWKK